MIDGLVRLLKYLDEKLIKDCYTIKYKGKPFSLNDIYVSGNSKGAFWKRKNIKDKYGKIFEDLLEEAHSQDKLKHFERFYLCIFYNSRHDVDNIVGMGKVFADTLRIEYVANDNKKHYKGMTIFVDEDLELNEFDFMIMDLK